MKEGAFIVLLGCLVFGVASCTLIRKSEKAADAVTLFAVTGTVTMNQVQTNTIPMLMKWMWEIQQNQNALITETRENAKKITEKATQFLVALTGLAGALAYYVRHRTKTPTQGKKK